jgi:hypothetical protein
MRQLAFLALVFLPLALYLGYAAIQRQRARAAGQEDPPPLLTDTPWLWLILAGAVLFAAALLSWALFGGAAPETTDVYVPPSDEGGVITPSRFE